jgi:hypothetical protein
MESIVFDKLHATKLYFEGGHSEKWTSIGGFDVTRDQRVMAYMSDSRYSGLYAQRFNAGARIQAEALRPGPDPFLLVLSSPRDRKRYGFQDLRWRNVNAPYSARSVGSSFGRDDRDQTPEHTLYR